MQKIIDERFGGNAARFAAVIGTQGAYVSRLKTTRPSHRRNIGEKKARSIEHACGLPPLWLDYDERADVLDEAMLLAGYRVATPEVRAIMEEAARRALNKELK